MVTLVEVPALAICSTDCRDRVGRGMPVWYLVPDGVVQYIAKRRLYRERPAPRRSADAAAAAPTAREPDSSTTGTVPDPHPPPIPHLQEVPR